MAAGRQGRRTLTRYSLLSYLVLNMNLWSGAMVLLLGFLRSTRTFGCANDNKCRFSSCIPG